MNSTVPTSNPYFDLMLRHLSDVTVELFAAYDFPIEHRDAASVTSPEAYCMASIGYVGDKVRGALVLAASQPAAIAWTRAAGGEDCDIADTIGEYSNMLLGRLKGRLLVEGIPISLATPMTVMGAGLRFSMAPGQSGWQLFEGPGWRLGTRLDASFEAGFGVHEVDAARPPAGAGDTILF